MYRDWQDPTATFARTFSDTLAIEGKRSMAASAVGLQVSRARLPRIEN